MSLDPILSAPLVIQLHVLSALPALLAGPVALFRRRRDRLHKTAGYLWVVAMVVLSVTGLFIPSHGLAIIGPFGPIHLLCLVALYGVTQGVRHARAGRIAAHRQSMQAVWFGAMGIAGLFTLMPGRIMNRVLFEALPEIGYLAVVSGGVGLALFWWRNLRGPVPA